MTAARTTETAFDWLREALRSRCGLRAEDVSDATLERALRAAASTAGVSVDDLAGRVRAPASDGGLALQHLLRKITVGETSFFRHAEDIEWLRTRALPALIARRERDGSRRLRIWSAGCASGEEAYTLAMLALEAVPSPEWEVQVMGSDINDESLGLARAASYGEWSFRGVSPEMRARWFVPVAGSSRDPRWTPLPAVRKVVELDYLNLRDPIYPSIFSRTTELDLVVCRNVFLYFFPEMIRTALERFSRCIANDGFVLCGPSDLFQAELPPRVSEEGAPHRLRAGAATSAPRATLAPRAAATPRPFVLSSRATPPAAARAAATATEPGLVRLLTAGSYVAAAAGAKEALRVNPLSLEVARCHALALSALSDSGAKDAWATVLYLDAADPGAHFALGMELLHERRQPEARAHFRAVVRLLRDVDDAARLPGPDALPAGWVRSACRSLAGEDEKGRTGA